MRRAHGYRLLSINSHEWKEMVEAGTLILPWSSREAVGETEWDEFTPRDRQILDALPHFYPGDDEESIQNRWRHVRWETSPGDLVLAHDGESVLGIARIAGISSLDTVGEPGYSLPMEILDDEPWLLSEADCYPRGFARLDKDELIVEIESRLWSVAC